MPVSPTNIAQSLAGLGAAERAKPAPRKEEAAGKVRRRGEDELIVGADAVDAAEKVKGLAGNSEEDAREDRESGEGAATYSPGEQRPKVPPRIDVAG